MYFIRGLTDKLSFSPCLEQVIRRLNIIGLWNFFKVSSQIYFYSFLYMSQKLEVMSSSAFLLEIVLHYRTIVPIEKSLVMHASLSSFLMVSCLSLPLLLLLEPSDFFFHLFITNFIAFLQFKSLFKVPLGRCFGMTSYPCPVQNFIELIRSYSL